MQEGKFEKHCRYGPIMLEKGLRARIEEERGKEKNKGNKGFAKIKEKKEAVTIKFEQNKVKIISHQNQIYIHQSVIQSKEHPNIIKFPPKSQSHSLFIYVGTQFTTNGYILLQFPNLIQRDLFICQIMEINGITIQQPFENLQNGSASNNSFETPTLMTPNITVGQNSTAFFQTQIREEEPRKKGGLVRLGSLQRDINQLMESDEETLPNQVLQDICDILYTPNSSDNFSYEMKEKFYEEEEDEQSFQNEELVKTIKNNDFVNMLVSCQSVVGDVREKKLKKESEKGIIQQTERKKEKEELKKRTNKNQRFGKKSFYCDESSEETEMNDKVERLTQINTHLLLENQKLRQENKKIMQAKNKKSKADYARIKEIRSLIGNMAHRIAYLEGFHEANHKVVKTNNDKAMKKVHSPPQTQRQTIEQGYKKINKEIGRGQFLKKQIPKELRYENVLKTLSPIKDQKEMHIDQISPKGSFNKTQKTEKMQNNVPESARKVSYNPVIRPSHKEISHKSPQTPPATLTNRYYSPKLSIESKKKNFYV